MSLLNLVLLDSQFRAQYFQFHEVLVHELTKYFNQCTDACTPAAELWDSCTAISCLCTEGTEAAIETCVNCAVPAEPSLVGMLEPVITQCKYRHLTLFPRPDSRALGFQIGTLCVPISRLLPSHCQHQPTQNLRQPPHPQQPQRQYHHLPLLVLQRMVQTRVSDLSLELQALQSLSL